MILLTAIGAFFKRIWDWIRQTAWVQPLLIVGIIFGVIFSIPSIVNAIKDAQTKANSVETYFHRYQISLAGGKESEAYRKTSLLKEKVEKTTIDENDVAEIQKEFGTAKFFFAYVADTCPDCANAKGGFDVLQKKWNTSNKDDQFYVENNESFSLFTIFSDEYTDETTSTETAFVQYLNTYIDFFEVAAESAQNTDYCANGKLSENSLEILSVADNQEFLTPTIFLIDFTEKAAQRSQKGISEVMFGVSADDDFARAKLLHDCWTHEGDFHIE